MNDSNYNEVSINNINERIHTCLLCELHKTRTHPVPGEGPCNAQIMIVGEGPGEQNDLLGRPFVGKGGHILDNCIEKAGLQRNDLFLTNLIKCRMPHNATPSASIIEHCCKYLDEQLSVINPLVIVTLGLPASKYFLNDNKVKLADICNSIKRYKSCSLICTYHPSSIRYNLEAKNRIISALTMAKNICNGET